ncbi:bifunctional 2-polyprenyl-6-hydroxyphenol methylase/3-demethylubiquinol 3-O-methyltransferase UbiG [Caulobacter sp. 17J65-9]|uniref:bifunctional 2-polyprenyl-6-hydroxyphenol methylase/3-demethylubiquinol 3-O-methyltransferase UbiG n=1 Tax=Caulobacter sp. 17J65-9 TaxID=2709382 RepID=UPI0013C564E5|nr:bifunctional 2-polyprenyl-6-hydroxyphenol methylase/3-demethylubiquinol 3-O-methyltransferase UbiG [Caulobacter sp. 17J65-9]NEX93968.1 bifunctional 2-polyprenyl-6-hydroxyphenol methylase/3-demethylubiquinol 3-O-methyltransferase UbiG [Caulobacter sp. 17J65-9]
MRDSTDQAQGFSVDPEEVARFSALAAKWWDAKGEFAPLHKFNPVRLGFIRDRACARFGRDPKAREPFKGLKLLDIGCGGGLLSEPMRRMGFEVTAVDASERNIGTARAHAEQQGLDIGYRCATAEQLAAEGAGPFDVVLNMEVVEHVADPGRYLRECAGLVAPGGMMIVATLNRTAKALALAVVGAEYVLRWLPPGTHDWKKFLKPEEVREYLAGAGVEVSGPYGVAYNPLTDRWSESNDTAVNYMMVATKPGA